ncbi:cupin domain-containing protein [Granulicella sibirica]|uniref:cupin domain-containing protein n=1 Tax=Granulicella sibirica TaxID=2479048 RepID=UPI00240E62A3|nr:cupin domain-containing protein [Granulicella sibirica]
MRFIETTPPGGGPPPRMHVKEEEIFTVLEGQYEFYKDGIWVPMVNGRAILSSRNTYHAFRNVGSAPGHMMLATIGGGIDDYFRAISGLTLPQDKERLTEISDHCGYHYLPSALFRSQSLFVLKSHQDLLSRVMSHTV